MPIRLSEIPDLRHTTSKRVGHRTKAVDDRFHAGCDDFVGPQASKAIMTINSRHEWETLFGLSKPMSITFVLFKGN